MRLHDLEKLLESKSTPVIVVDVQPAYEDYIHNKIDMSELMEFLNKQNSKILMLVNDKETGLTDDEIHECEEFWFEYGLDDDTFQELEIVSKGYGFLRSWMDTGVPDKVIIKVIRLLYQKKLNSTDDLEEDELKVVVGEEHYKDWMLIDPLSVNWLSVAKLREYNNCYIMGGGEEECLKEVQLLMNAFNIKYKVIEKFVY